jgi:molybdopterin/thiamine biosynthesis adenylyltransferase/rhodanese-related sulfurtransferase
MSNENPPFASKELSPREAQERALRGERLIDIRDAHERELGFAEGSIAIPRDQLEHEHRRLLADPDEPVMLICARGARSLAATITLRQQGHTRISSVAGGTEAWQRAGLPMSTPDEDAEFMQRYSRHLLLPQVGMSGQRLLRRSRVLMIGAGGLGSPAAFYLAAAGLGRIVLADDDRVDRSNLQRQILHTDARVGELKVESARVALAALNPDVAIEAVAERVTRENIDRLIDDVDLVIDGTDNFALRYLVSDACVKHGKPLVYGAVHRFEGQVSVFDAGRQRGVAPCYRCLFPEPPSAADAPNCAEAGVLGVLPGVIGLLQANEAIKLLLGIGTPLVGRLLSFDALAARFRETRLAPDPRCVVCAVGLEFPGYIDYQQFCAG